MVRTRGLDAHALSSRNAFGRVVYRRLAPTTETRPALFEPIRVSRSPFHRRRIHRHRLVSMVILQPGLVARGMLRLPCAAGPKNRPTDLCKPIFSKKRTRSRSSISAVVAFAASAPMACAVHAAPTAEAVYRSQLVDPRFRGHSPRRSATSDAPVIARPPRAWLSPCPRLPHDLGRFHAEPVKDIRAETTRSAFRRWMPSSGLPRSRDFAAAIRLSPPFHLPRCHPPQASSPSTSAEHEPLETSSNGDFIESRRRPPTSAVRPSSRARSRALDPRRAFAR